MTAKMPLQVVELRQPRCNLRFGTYPCVAAISADGEVTVKEAEMLRAIGARLGCPVPPVVAGEFQG